MARSIGILFGVLCFIVYPAGADWPVDPAENLVICNHSGEQTVPKVAVTSDGGCYVGWHDNASGNYDIYLQRLNGDGVPQWEENGMLISNHPQESWITDWDLTTDNADHCIIAINDIRAGGDWDIYGYRISPDGDFLWGANGIALSDNANFEPTPRVIATNGGNAVFAWQEDVGGVNVIHLRKITPSGQDVWNPATLTITSPLEFGLSIPRIAPGENDGVILQYLILQGSGMYAQRHIYLQKFDSLGAMQWTPNGVLISNAGGISAFMSPDVLSDGAGGAISYWYDTHDQNRHHVFVQHTNAAGTVLWTANGVQTSISTTELQMSPGVAYQPLTGDVFAFYQITNLGQTQTGLGGQRINSAGQRQWGSSGIAFRPLGSPQPSYVTVHALDSRAIVVYKEGSPENESLTYVKGFRVNQVGNQVWSGGFRNLSSVATEKVHLDAAINGIGQVMAVWPDGRSGATDIYLQNINPDGSLGNYGEIPVIDITDPPDSTTVHETPLTVRYTVDGFQVAPAGGNGLIDLRVGGIHLSYVSNPDSLILVQLPLGWNAIVLELVDYNGLPLDPPTLDSVHVRFVPPPSITITAPLDYHDIGMDIMVPVTIRYDVENFVIAPVGGDGVIDLRLDGVHRSYVTDSDSASVVVDSFYQWYTVTLELVDYSYQSLDPPVLDSVHFFIVDVSADEYADVIPRKITLLPAYPNPFNASTVIRFALPKAEPVKLVVYNLLGEQVAVLAEGVFDAGYHARPFDGAGLASGSYIYRLETPTATEQRTMLLLK